MKSIRTEGPAGLGIRFIPLVLLFASAASAQETVQLEGRVLDLDGNPIQDCVVVLGDLDRPGGPGTTEALMAQAVTHTDVEGRYELTTTGPSVFGVGIWFGSPGHCVARLWHRLRSGRVPTIALPEAVQVVGRVRDPEVRPIPGARVTGRDLAPSELTLSETVETGSDGIFVLHSVPASPLELRIDAEGYASARLLPVDRSSPMDVTLEALVPSSGRLLDAEGHPVAGYVGVEYEDDGFASARAGDDGRFEVMVIPGLRYRVRSYDDASMHVSMTWAESGILEGSARGIELRMPGGEGDRQIELTVTEAESGQPVDGFQAMFDFLTPQSQGFGITYSIFSSSLSGFQALEGREGKLHLPFSSRWEPGHGFLIVRAPGRGEVVAALRRSITAGNRVRIGIEMPPERFIAGTVTDAEGNPVSGAKVWPFLSDGSIGGYSSMPEAVKTDAEGRFRIGGLAAAEYALNVAHESLAQVHCVNASLVEESLEGLPVTLPRLEQLEIRWTNPPEEDGWEINLDPRWPRQAPAESLPRQLDSGRIRRAVDLNQALVVQRAEVEDYTVSLYRMTQGQLAHSVGLPRERLRLDDRSEYTVDLGHAHTGRIRGRVSTSLPVGLDRLMVRIRSGRSGPGPGPDAISMSLVAPDGSFTLEPLVGSWVVEVVDILTGFPVGQSHEVQVVSGEDAECTVKFAAGIVDVTLEPPEGATRTAMSQLVLRLPPKYGPAGPVKLSSSSVIVSSSGMNSTGPVKQFALAGLRGELRFVLPPGDVEIGFQRSEGRLGRSREGRFVDVRVFPVEVTEGEVRSMVLQEPPRLSAKRLAEEGGR